VETKIKKGYLPTERCKNCGSCCKNYPGSIFPHQVDDEEVRRMLKSGQYSIDWWEGDSPLYFLRPATKDSIGKIFDPSWGGECVFLTEKGCRLPRSEMPHGCIMLKPSVEGKCISYSDSKYGAAIAWEKSSIDLNNIGKEVEWES
jgi:Fe-S-cluster containining protein